MGQDSSSFISDDGDDHGDDGDHDDDDGRGDDGDDHDAQSRAPHEQLRHSSHVLETRSHLRASSHRPLVPSPHARQLPRHVPHGDGCGGDDDDDDDSFSFLFFVSGLMECSRPFCTARSDYGSNSASQRGINPYSEDASLFTDVRSQKHAVWPNPTPEHGTRDLGHHLLVR